MEGLGMLGGDSAVGAAAQGVGAGIGGSLLSGLTGFWEKDWGAAATSKAWRRAMFASNTAITRRVEDMKNAGINPILAAGDAASSPGASVAPIPHMDLARGFERGVSAAKEARTQNAVVARAEADAKTAEANQATAEVTAENAREFGRDTALYRRNQDLEAWRNAVGQGLYLASQRASTDALAGRIAADTARTRALMVEDAARAKWIEENPGLYSAEQAGRALQPGISAAGDVLRKGVELKTGTKGRTVHHIHRRFK